MSAKTQASMAQRVDAVVAIVQARSNSSTMEVADKVTAELGESLTAGQLAVALRKAVEAGRLEKWQDYRYDDQRTRDTLFGGAGVCIRRFNRYKIPA